jgi:predicted kinase
VLCGPAFSGKTTLAREIVARTGWVHHSADGINERRGLAGGFAIPIEAWAETHRQLCAAVATSLAAGHTTLADDTSCFRFLRDALRRAAARAGAAVWVVALRTPAAIVIARAEANAAAVRPSRPGVDLAALREQLATFEWPAPDEPTVDFPPDEDIEVWIRALRERERRVRRGAEEGGRAG